MKTLTDKMNDTHDAIRDSARAVMMARGSLALPAMRLGQLNMTEPQRAEIEKVI